MPIISLSTKGLNKLKNSLNENNFKFIINNKFEYNCPKLLTDFISPIIFKLHQSDPTLNFINLNLKNYQNNFNKFLNLIYGEEIEFNDNDKEFLFEISKKLGNFEIINQFINKLPQNINKENVINIILNNYFLEISIEKEISFLAENFYLFNENELKKLNFEILNEILNHNLLKIEDENKLFLFIVNLINEKNIKFLNLLKLIKIENLNKEQLINFINLIENNNLILLLWNNFKNFILNNNNNKTSNRYFIDSSQKVVFNGNNFDGIFNYLKKKNNSNNIHDNGIINLTGSSVYQNMIPKNILENNNSLYFESNNIENDYFLVEFKENKIMLNGYSINSSTNTGNTLKSWKILGSNDCSNWDELDDQNNFIEFKNKEISKYFQCKTQKIKFYKFIKVQFTAPTWNDTWYISLGQLELFGNII